MPEEKPLHVEFKFTDDSKTLVRFELPPKLEADADGITRLIALFSRVRAAMNPEFPEGAPPPIDAQSHVIDDPEIALAADTYGAMISVLHPGVGWIRCRLRPEHLRRLSVGLETLAQTARDSPTH